MKSPGNQSDGVGWEAGGPGGVETAGPEVWSPQGGLRTGEPTRHPNAPPPAQSGSSETPQSQKKWRKDSPWVSHHGNGEARASEGQGATR